MVHTGTYRKFGSKHHLNHWVVLAKPLFYKSSFVKWEASSLPWTRCLNSWGLFTILFVHPDGEAEVEGNWVSTLLGQDRSLDTYLLNNFIYHFSIKTILKWLTIKKYAEETSTNCHLNRYYAGRNWDKWCFPAKFKRANSYKRLIDQAATSILKVLVLCPLSYL